MFRWLERRRGRGYGTDPDTWHAPVVEQWRHRIGRLFGPGRYFDLTIHGFDHVPTGAPAMLVSNHSGGTTIPDVWGLAVAWYRRFGVDRPLYILGHDMIFSNSITGRFFEQCGVMRASSQVARDVLGGRRRDLLVLPGGDVEVWRPFRERYRVDFAGRLGYARIAIATGVPIVPVAHAGAHETLYVLSSGKSLARRLGLKRLTRAEIWPIHLSLPWGIGLGPLPHIPLPARFRYLLGAPIAPTTDDPRDDRGVRRLDEQVRAAVQGQLDLLGRK